MYNFQKNTSISRLCVVKKVADSW